MQINHLFSSRALCLRKLHVRNQTSHNVSCFLFFPLLRKCFNLSLVVRVVSQLLERCSYINSCADVVKLFVSDTYTAVASKYIEILPCNVHVVHHDELQVELSLHA